jgi:hypothetical protein
MKGLVVEGITLQTHSAEISSSIPYIEYSSHCTLAAIYSCIPIAACPCSSIVVFILVHLSYICINEMLYFSKKDHRRSYSCHPLVIILLLSLSPDFRMSPNVVWLFGRSSQPRLADSVSVFTYAVY